MQTAVVGLVTQRQNPVSDVPQYTPQGAEFFLLLGLLLAAPTEPREPRPPKKV